MSEKEVMAQLLTALKKVKGFEDRAKELADSYGVCVCVCVCDVFLMH